MLCSRERRRTAAVLFILTGTFKRRYYCIQRLGDSALHGAAWKGQTEMIELLLYVFGVRVLIFGRARIHMRTHILSQCEARFTPTPPHTHTYTHAPPPLSLSLSLVYTRTQSPPPAPLSHNTSVNTRPRDILVTVTVLLKSDIRNPSKRRLKGADRNVTNKSGETPYDLAARSPEAQRLLRVTGKVRATDADEYGDSDDDDDGED